MQSVRSKKLITKNVSGVAYVGESWNPMLLAFFLVVLLAGAADATSSGVQSFFLDKKLGTTLTE
ncbi:hypothetical protein C8F04DRAFT_1401628 [Mycena alexandri]|uniref:Uncharacterized protein n=1 Tax=Mycena alexandri TaxID=1745969 RepID=A0AAD6S9U0_9AGAR|nr:hypothetical protein C8F04DRAFT_1401628 [Mycena alexandri]